MRNRSRAPFFSADDRDAQRVARELEVLSDLESWQPRGRHAADVAPAWSEARTRLHRILVSFSLL